MQVFINLPKFRPNLPPFTLRCADVQLQLKRFFAIVLIAVSPCAAWAFAAKVTKISDGDTLWVRPESGGAPRKLRLLGLDAPEICQPGGLAAREALRRMVSSAQVQVQVTYMDDYGRGLARLTVNGQDVGAQLVQAGHAWSGRWRASLGPYAEEEAQARRARRGVFVDSAAELPRQFRQRHGPCPY